MGYKLKGNNLIYCATNIVSFRKKANGRRLYVDCVDKESGARVYTILSAIYKPKKVEKGANFWDFTLVFPSTYDRDKAYDDLSGAYTEYIESNNVLVDDDETLLNPGGNDDTGNDDDDMPERNAPTSAPSSHAPTTRRTP